MDRIIDPVHGFIDLTQVEKEIVGLPIFKRMQSLKQLSLTNWVFPGAEHTRYMHSLGVMYIADLMAINLKKLDGHPRFNDGERQLLRLAGLLHDIGHYPLSHVTEYVYSDNLLEENDTLLAINKNVKKKIDSLLDDTKMPEYMKSRSSKPMHHETMGKKVIENDTTIKQIIKKYCPFIDIEDICDIIVGNIERNPKISTMVQLIHSELDADGIDYVMRDASFSGTSYGSFELGLLLRNLVVTNYNGFEIVGIKPKGISIVDQYLISKYFSYTQVIFNKHVAIFDTMVEIFSNHLIKLSKSTYPSSIDLNKYIENHMTNDEFLKFTDRSFWTQLDNLQNNDLKGIVPEYVVRIFEKLSHYQEFNITKNGEIIITSDNKEDIQNILKKSNLYSSLLNENEDKLFLYHVRGFTTEIPEKNYRELINQLELKDVNEENFKSKNVLRLQEGIAIIENGKAPKLLVDDSRSIMSHLYNTKTYILRQYDVE